MVATQSFSISRRTLDVEDYIDIGRRHAGWIVGPAFFGLVASICVAFMLPNEYTSKATMQITPAQISDSMIQSTISNSLNERIQQMQTSIESRAVLSAIINDPHLLLYQNEIKAKPLEDVIEEMRNAIQIQFVMLPGALGKRASAFDIKFTYEDRFKAKATVEALMAKFEEENQNTQKSDQDAVKGLVGDLLQKARADLNAANDSLTTFKEGNAGKLPEQVQLNLGRDASYTAKIESINNAIFRDRQALAQLQIQRDTVNGKLEYYQQEQTALASIAGAPGSPAAQQNQDLLALGKYIESLTFQLQQLRRRFAETYPDVKAARLQLEGFQAKYDELDKAIKAKAAAAAQKAAEEAAKPKQAVKTMADLREAAVRRDVDEQLKAIANSEKQYNDNIARSEAELTTYKKDSDEVNQLLKDSTGVEAAYEDLRNTKAMAEQTYQELLRKNQMADQEGQLIQRRAGEVLDVLDVANLPSSPTKPNRYFIIGAGFAMSIVLGLAMAGLQEAKDTSLKNLKDVRAYTNLPVLCSIPLLENTMLVKRKRRLTYLAWAAAVVVGAAAVSGAVVYYLTYTIKS